MPPRPELERIYDRHAACAAALFRRFTQGNEAGVWTRDYDRVGTGEADPRP